MSLENWLVMALAVEGVGLVLCDYLMKKNLADGVTDEQVRWRPLYWSKDELFSARGNLFRRAAVVLGILVMVTFVAIAVTFDVS